MIVRIKYDGEIQEFKFLKKAYPGTGNLAICILIREDEDQAWEQWGFLTIDLSARLGSLKGDNVAFLSWRRSREIIKWLFENNYAKEGGDVVVFDHFYTLVEFSKEFMENILCIPE